MTAAEGCLRLVEELPSSMVEVLIAQLRGGDPPMMPNPGYQAKVGELLRSNVSVRSELAPMLEVALAAKRSRHTTELVWTGPPTPVVPVRQTEQVLSDLIRGAQRSLTITSFGIYQVPRLVDAMELALDRGIAVRIVMGDREAHSDQAIDQQRRQLGRSVAGRATLLQWPLDRRSRDEQGHAGMMHVKAAVADSRTAFLTSANLTEAALERNMELGVLLRGGIVPAAIDRLIDALVESGELKCV